MYLWNLSLECVLYANFVYCACKQYYTLAIFRVYKSFETVCSFGKHNYTRAIIRVYENFTTILGQ